MGCGCSGKVADNAETQKYILKVVTPMPQKEDVLPTTQCLKCTQKHACEAWECFHEYGYSMQNRRHIIGALRAVVLHTYKNWPNLATMAREAALLVQDAKDDDADVAIESLCNAIDEAYLQEFHDVKKRLGELAAAKVVDSTHAIGGH